MTNYLGMDFSSFKEEQKDLLRNSDIFKDFDFEGSNISVLLELLAYTMELNTYYQNKIVENLYMDTASLYNTVHRIAGHKGYIPKGHISAYATLSITASGDYSDEQLYIPEYSVFATEDNTRFITTKDHTFTVPSSATDSFIFEIGVKEGTHERLSYTGRDMVDYSIILPTVAYDNDYNEVNDEESIKVYVNNTPWTRISNFFDEISGLSDDDNVFTFYYNKYQNYTVLFSSTRNFPDKLDNITIDLIRSKGADGSTGSNLITTASEKFITASNSGSVSLDSITITNPEATRWASDPETIEEIKKNANNHINRQYRCVTPKDFRTFLEERTDISTANVWGEKEIAPSGDIQEYNKIHLSTIPDEWKSSTISVQTSGWTPSPDVNTVSINVPQSYSSEYKSSISKYIEPRKVMNSFEIYEVPHLIYFYFEIGIIPKRIYNFNNISNDIKDKLLYYFDPENRNFGEVIDFREIENFVLDVTKTSLSNNFDKVRGIQNFTFRDIITSTEIYEYNSGSYPQYNSSAFDNNIDNILRPIKLWYNQFPQITRDSIMIYNEG